MAIQARVSPPAPTARHAERDRLRSIRMPPPNERTAGHHRSTPYSDINLDEALPTGIPIVKRGVELALQCLDAELLFVITLCLRDRQQP